MQDISVGSVSGIFSAKEVFYVSTLEQIRDLNIENVEPEHFIELGSEVVQALRDILGDDAVREIYDGAKGEENEGFGERFADALERYTEIHGELFHPPDVEPLAAADVVSTADIGESLDELRQKYQDMRDTHLSRNIFVSWEKLRVDLAARQNNEVGADGKHKVSGGTIAVDVLGIIRGNIFETIIEEVVRGILDSIFPAEKDPVTTDDTTEFPRDAALDSATEQPILTDGFGVEDSGFVEDLSKLKPEDISALRSANPLYGQHFGFDMTRNSVQSGSMKIWRGGFHQNVDTVINSEIKSVGIPRISMVELGQNLYHVSPFGKILNSEIRNEKTELPIGSTIERLDISSGARREIFEARAVELGCTVDELKARYTAEIQESFIARVENGLDGHANYLKETAIPEMENLKESYGRDLFVLDARETAIRAEIERLPEHGEDSSDERKQELSERLDKIAEYRSEIEKGVSRIEDREEGLRDTLERYAECKEALALPGTDTDSRYMMVSNMEKDATGRTEISEYIPSRIDHEIREFTAAEREELIQDVERYNEQNPDNILREKDGSLYNRYGISETGVFDRDMCMDKDSPELETDEDVEKYAAAHETDGFSDFQEFLEHPEQPADMVERTEAEKEPETDKGISDLEIPEQQETPEDIETTEQVSADSASDPIEQQEENRGEVSQEEIDSENELDQAVADTLEAVDSDKKAEKEEGSFDGDVSDVTGSEELEDIPIDSEPKNLQIDPTEAAVSPETAADGIKGQGNDEEKDRKEIEKEDDGEGDSSYDEILGGFRDYLEDDTYSFSGDLLPTIQDMDPKAADQIMENALRDLYMETDMSQNDRLFTLTAEVATFSDHGVMPTIEHLVNGLQEQGMSDHDIAQTLVDMEPYILRGLDDLVSIAADDVEQRIVKIGDDIWTVHADSIVNDVTGMEEDPNHLIDLISGAINSVYGDGVGDVAAEQTMQHLESMDDSNGLDFLDEFFGNSLESTLQQMMTDLIPDSVREDYVDMATADQLEDSYDPMEAGSLGDQELDMLYDDDAMFMPDVDADALLEDF